MDRVILHIDMNNFYASVETLYDPSLRDVPMAVGGDKERRHGIVLAKNMLAKAQGVKTAEALWEAERKCPGIRFVPPHFERYLKYSRLAKEIYMQYTDQVESFGLDECWLDVTGSTRLFGSGREIAEEIRSRIKDELGLTVSVGVSFNKIFAKLGSDYKKPDAVTEFTRENFRELVWPLSASELLFVGKSTQESLRKYGLYTIGDVAKADRKLLERLLGKNGLQLSLYANGEDMSPVQHVLEESEVKSVGNSTTAIHDLRDDGEIRAELYVLSESVARRLREKGFSGCNVQLYVRKYDLQFYQRQITLDTAVADSESIFRAAYGLYKTHHTGESIRSIGVRVTSLVPLETEQFSLFGDAAHAKKMQKLDSAVDLLRGRFGSDIVCRGIRQMHKDLFETEDEHRRTHVENPFRGAAV
ncbi:MAG: DNA polymerase IV [Clostridia bacterium]|nr:DNA polymerase IV [Clostridia bacterium]